MNDSAPISTSLPPAPAERLPRGKAVAGRAVHVVVVDDDELSRNLQSRLLALLGYSSIAVQDAESALQAARAPDVDGMLLDLGMPELDGFEVIQRIRAEEARVGRAPLPVIAVTGYASDTDRLRCLVSGFNDHLSKPVDAATLGEVMARHFPQSGPHGMAGSQGPANDALRVQATAARLARMKPADVSFAPTMLETFAMRSGQLVEEAETCVRGNDAEGLARTLQALSASAEFMGALGLVRASQALGQAMAGDGKSSEALSRLVAEHQAVLTLLLSTAQHRRTAA